jgi:hypothetical protein
MTQALVRTLDHPIARQQPLAGAPPHSDCGSQYAADASPVPGSPAMTPPEHESAGARVGSCVDRVPAHPAQKAYVYPNQVRTQADAGRPSSTTSRSSTIDSACTAPRATDRPRRRLSPCSPLKRCRGHIRLSAIGR